MHTVVETPLFASLWPDYWSEDERAEFAAFLSANPHAGEVVRHSGGCRKVRWAREGTGKRGGVRVIYFNQLDDGRIVLLTMYAKSARETLPADVLRRIARELVE